MNVTGEIVELRENVDRIRDCRMSVGSALPADTTPTVEEALGHAARILRNAEVETNLALMERLESLADTWVGLASLLIHLRET